MKKYSLFLIITLIVTLLSGCNNSEDVKQLITGKTWRLSCYYYKNGNTAIDRYPNANKILMDNMDGFYLTFYENNTFSGKGAKCSFSGTWRGDGKNNDFSMNINQLSGAESETIAIDFINAVKGVVSYKSDYNNLELYYKYKNEYMSFYVKKQQSVK